MKRAADELGAHVSVAGGVERAPERAAEIDAVVVQVFTKQPSRWAEPTLTAERIARFRAERAVHAIRVVASHDSYLINLASPDPVLFERSYASFRDELRRCRDLGIELLVTHPGNVTDGDRDRGVRQNADAIRRALVEVGGDTVVLLESTAGAGSVLGASFAELAAIRDAVAGAAQDRVAFCIDTCHVWAAGYDLAGDYDAVMRQADDVLGFRRIRLFHLNDSVAGRGSRRDRHAHIGDGTLGPEPFRRLMTDPGLRSIPKVLETPKGDDAVANDRRNLERLRGFRAASPAGAGARGRAARAK